MNYHISTTLIWDNFKKLSECPVCDIYREVEERLIEQFQGEAVMIDEFRDRVNREGFCQKHLFMLQKGENKLGTSLQMRTRLQHLVSHLPKIGKVKQAAKAADEIDRKIDSCVICASIEENMQRYYKTIAQLFEHDEQFQRLLNQSKGFCLHHYAELVRHAAHAKGAAEGYLDKLQTLEKQSLTRILNELDAFAEKFDYRNKDKPVGTEKDVLPRAAAKMHGEE